MIKQANRLNTVEEYYFSKKLREVSELIFSGESIINMGIGSPDLFPSKKVIEALSSSLSDEFAHKYQSYQGIFELRKAISDFYFRFFKVDCDPNNEVLPLMGSKEGIMHISLAFLTAIFILKSGSSNEGYKLLYLSSFSDINFLFNISF